jgi:hypothetical protein
MCRVMKVPSRPSAISTDALKTVPSKANFTTACRRQIETGCA